jgi:hypothetical protein
MFLHMRNASLRWGSLPLPGDERATPPRACAKVCACLSG